MDCLFHNALPPNSVHFQCSYIRSLASSTPSEIATRHRFPPSLNSPRHQYDILNTAKSTQEYQAVTSHMLLQSPSVWR